MTTFIEKISVEKALYMLEMPYSEYKTVTSRGDECKNEDERKGKFEKLRKLCTDVVHNNGSVERTYKYSENMATMGRQYANGVQGVIREVRGFLMNHTTDIDMKNAHPVILLYLCKTLLPNVTCTNLEYYCNHRDEILLTHINLDRDAAKKLYLKSLYKDKTDKNIKNPFFRKFDNEIKKIQTAVAALPEFKHICDTVPSDKGYNEEGSQLSRIVTVYEDKILGVALEVLKGRQIDIAALMFDGCMVYGDYYKNPELLDQIEVACESAFDGLNIKWDYKGHCTNITIPEGWMSKSLVNAVKETTFADATNNSTVVFKRLSAEFEQTHAKIRNRSLFVKETPTKTLLFTKANLITSYEHMECGVNLQGVPQIFIKKWLSYNDKIRSFDDMGIYPNMSKCPTNMYNLWRPFAMESYTEPYEPNYKALQFYLNHIKVLCGNDQTVADYIVAWISQMIQYPEVKTIMPTFIAGEGTGKSTLIISLSKMMGASKIFETTSPSRDVWGDFNGVMCDSFLVHLAEISKKECMESRGKIKGLITDPTLIINNKGLGQYPIDSYHRFIATTNNEDSIPTEKGDRRNLVIRCSDEKKGDTEYFNTMYKYLDDNDVIRTLYDYFKSIPNMDKFHEIPLPKTEYQEDMKASNRSPIEMWLEDFTREHGSKEVVTLESKDVFSSFKSWVSSHNMSYEVNSIKFMVRLKNLNIDGITTKLTKVGSSKVFDIAKMEVFFGITYDVSSENNTDDEEEEFVEG